MKNPVFTISTRPIGGGVIETVINLKGEVGVRQNKRLDTPEPFQWEHMKPHVTRSLGDRVNTILTIHDLNVALTEQIIECWTYEDIVRKFTDPGTCESTMFSEATKLMSRFGGMSTPKSE